MLDAWFSKNPEMNAEWVDDFTSDSIPQELVEAEKPYVDAMNANMRDDDGGGKAKSDMMRYAFPIDSQRVVKADSDGITSEDRSENGDVLLVGGNNADGKSYLNDYKAALVPSYMPDNDKEILRSHGLDVVPYGIGERDSALIKYLDGNGTNETSGEQSGSNGLMFEPTQEDREKFVKEWHDDVKAAGYEEVKAFMDHPNTASKIARWNGSTLFEASEDKRYMDAVNFGDMETAQRIVDNVALKKGYINDYDYRMMHQAPHSGNDMARTSTSSLILIQTWFRTTTGTTPIGTASGMISADTSHSTRFPR